MEGILSTAIGLSGTPKDYTGIQAARQRQQEVGQQRKQLARDKELGDLRESMVIKDGLYLDGRSPQIERYQAESIDEMQKLYNAGNFNELNKRKQQYFNVMNGLKQERKDVDEIVKGIRDGKLFTGGDVQRLYNSKDFDKTIAELAEQGEIEYNPQDPLSPIKVKPFPNYDAEKLFNAVAKSLPTDQFTTKEVPLFGGGTKTMMIYTGDPETLARQNGIMFDSNPNIQKGEMILAKQSNPNTSNEELREIARNNWIEKGADFLREKRSVTSQGRAGGGDGGGEQQVPSNIQLTEATIPFTVNMGDPKTFDFAKGLLKKYNIPTPKTDEGGTLTLTSPAFTTSQATYKATTLAQKGTRDVFTGEALDKANVINQSYNQTIIIPVFNDPKSVDDGLAIPDLFMNDPRVLKELKEKGKIRYEIVSIGDKGRAVQYNSIQGSGFMGESEKDKGLLKSLDSVLKAKQKELNDALKSSGSGSTAEPPTGGQPTDKRPASDANTSKMKLDGVDRDIPKGAKIVYSKQTGKALGYEFNNQKVKF